MKLDSSGRNKLRSVVSAERRQIISKWNRGVLPRRRRGRRVHVREIAARILSSYLLARAPLSAVSAVIATNVGATAVLKLSIAIF